jgi:anti-sigma regulatory factor (Ser/Thr protein kinase)
MDNELQITVAAELSSLPSVRKFIDEACREFRIVDEACYDIKLAVEEACTNIIEHGPKGVEPGSLVLILESGEKQLTVKLTDFGRPFVPDAPPTPDAEANLAVGKVGGFGLYFIHRSMDEVAYEPGEKSNTLTMIKILDEEMP